MEDKEVTEFNLQQDRRGQIWESLRGVSYEEMGKMFCYLFGYIGSSPALSEFLDALTEAMDFLRIPMERVKGAKNGEKPS